METNKKKLDAKESILHIVDKISARGTVLGLLVGLLPAALLFYLAWVMMISPGISANETASAEAAKLESEVMRGIAVEKSEKAFRQEFKKTVELFYDSLPLLPKETEISNVLGAVKNIALSNNVELTGLESVKIGQKTANADKLYEREIPASVVGSYTDVMRFFMAVTRQTRIIIIRDYAVESADGKTKSVRPKYVSVDFTMLAYHTPPTNEFPTVTLPEVSQPFPTTATTHKVTLPAKPAQANAK